MILRCCWLLATLVPYAFADVKFTSPAAGTTLTVPTLSIKWEDSGSAPPISELVSYQMFLMAGGNDATNYIQLATLVSTGDFSTGNSASGTITAGLGASIENAYFIKVISVATGGTVENFSDRFSISGMDGVFPAAVTTGLKTVTGTAGPATINNIADTQNPAAGAGQGATPAVAAGEYTVAYTLQTGLTRYAPMPIMPPTKISAKNASPQWPTSSYTPYVQAAGSPNAVTTNTLTQTFSGQSIENTATPQPTGAMEKFLNRWKD